MALVFADRVKDSSTTTGTGTFTISGTAATGYQTFNSGIGVGNTCYYCIAGQAGSTDPTEWEVGLGTLSTATTITRSAGNVLSGSSGAGTLVNFSAGTKDVFVTSPALWATSPSFTGTVGVASQLNLTNASNWNLYASGAGANYMAGQLSIGTTTLTNGLLTVNATQSNSAYQFYVSGTNSNASTTIGSFYNSLSLTGASATTVYGINNVTSYNANAATAIYGISSTVNIGAAALGGSTIGVMSSYVAQIPAVNGSVTSTITSAIQFYATAISSSKITNAYAFYGNQYASGSTNNWNLYVPGTSANYLVGQLVIGPSTTLTNGFFAITSTSSNAAYSIYIAGTNSSSAGTLGSIKNSPTITGAAATSIYGLDNSFTYNANAATSIYGTNTTIVIGAAALGGSTISSMWSYLAQPPSINGSATTAITNAYQYYADNITQGSAQTISNAYAFYGNQAASGATAQWNLYMAGGAPNYLAGQLSVGSTTLNVAQIYFAGNTTKQSNIQITGTNTYAGNCFGLYLNPTMIGSSATVASYCQYTVAGWAFAAGASISSATLHQATSYLNGTVTPGSIYVFSALSNYTSAATGGTVGAYYGFNAASPGFTTATTGTTLYHGFNAANVAGTATSAIGTVYAYRGQQASSNTGVTNNWNLYMDGTAKNYLNGALGIGTTTVGSTLTVAGPIALKTPSTVSTATYSQATTDSTITFTTAGTCTLTLLAAASYPGQILHIRSGTTSGTTTVTSASSNVVPLNSTTAGTAIMASTGKFTVLQSDGTNWLVIMQV